MPDINRWKEKIQTLPALRTIVAERRRRGERVVLANGCFDLLHVGHIRYLREARSLGDLLIVAVNSDASVRRLKGEGRPIIPEGERLEILAAITYIDYLLLFDEPDVRRILLELKPDIQVKGTDYTVETIPEREVVLGYGGRLAIAGDPKDHSSTALLERIARLYAPR
ncbi:MAG: D-glycero-beta-D-manno-heptose 1-phosphate adenylyltransferase [Nitrospinota bacterium]|nr:MAG: D-glycero-beta-D-manno-heptose 1-phosphate adenylyltransferase [Nitrospinota bacterium]